jgi:hypothetical protein
MSSWSTFTAPFTALHHPEFWLVSSAHRPLLARSIYLKKSKSGRLAREVPQLRTSRENSGVAWRGPKSVGKDPLLARASHYKRNRKHWQRLGLPCSICHRPIDYTGPNLVNGRQNPRTLVVGHIVSRYHAKRLGWTEAMINSVSNTRPECRACSNRTGAQLGQRVQRANAKVRVGLSDRDRW